MKKLFAASLLAATAAAHANMTWNSFNQSMDMSIYGVTVTQENPDAGFQMAYDVTFQKGAYFTVAGSSAKYYIDYIKGFYVVTKSETDYIGAQEYIGAALHEPTGPTSTNQPLNPTTTYSSDPNPGPFNLAGAENWHSDSTSTTGAGAISGNYAGWDLSQTPNGKDALFAGYTEEFEFTKLNFKHAQSGIEFGFEVGLVQSNLDGLTVNSFPTPGFTPDSGKPVYSGYISDNAGPLAPSPGAFASFAIGALGMLRRKFRRS